MRLAPRTRLVAGLTLGVVALLALVGAVLSVVLAPREPRLWLGLSLGVLALVVLAEVALLVLDRPEKA